VVYFFFKWLHFVAIISWMAGVLYLYRLLVNQSEHGHKPDNHALLDLMARRLYRYITVPAMVAAFVGGLGMISINHGIAATGWFQVKFVCVLALAAATIYAKRLVTRFGNKEANVPSSKRLRLYNEIPTILMLIIVGLAVFRPF
jgi:putative membrane protein